MKIAASRAPDAEREVSPAELFFDRDWERVAKDLVRREFRTWWGGPHVRFHQTGVKRIHHPIVGDFELTCSWRRRRRSARRSNAWNFAPWDAPASRSQSSASAR